MRKAEISAQNERNIVRDHIEEIKNLYEVDCLSVTEIGKLFNVKYHNIKPIMVELGVHLRTWSETQKIIMNRPNVKKNISEGSKRSQSKRKETNIKKYGAEVASNGINWKDDYEKEHGVRHPNQKQEFIDRMTGDNNPAKRLDSRQKIKENRWKKKPQEELDYIWNKTKDTWIVNLGVDNPLKSEKIVDIIRETVFKERGVDWITKDPEVKQKGKETHFFRMKETIKDRLELLNLELIDDFTKVTDLIKIKCKTCGNIFETVLDYVFHDYGICRKCYPLNSSIPEREIRDFINEILPDKEIIFNDRKILEGKEIDILIPELKIGIEHDGIYTSYLLNNSLKAWFRNSVPLSHSINLHFVSFNIGSIASFIVSLYLFFIGIS